MAFAADAGSMEKVRECGLMLFRDGRRKAPRIVGEEE
jgi:hypothetical protein